MYRDLGFLRVWGGLGERAHAAGSVLRLPDLPAPADRRLRAADRRPAERVLRRVPRPHASLRQRAATRLRRRACEVDGAARRRASADRGGEHASARAARSIPSASGATSCACRAGSAREATAQQISCAPREHLSCIRRKTPQPRPHRGSRARRRALLPARDRLHRRGSRQADRRRRALVDRDDAVQLQQPRARRQGQGGHPRRRRHADGAEHDRDLRRDHDGHCRHARLARLTRDHRRLDRARRQRARIRRARDDLRLRQDDPRHRDGARAPEHSRTDALRRLDQARPLQRRRGDDPASLRGRRPVRRRQDHRGRAARTGGGRLARRRRVRRSVHGEHDGDGLRGARHLADRLGDGPGRGRPQARGRQAVRRTRHGRPAPWSAPERRDHQAGAAERDRRRRDERRLDQRRAAPARGRARNGRAARARRVRGDLRAHAAAVRPAARRSVRRDRALRSRRRAARAQAAEGRRHPQRAMRRP